MLSVLMSLKKAFEKIAGKGENARYQHFLLHPQCFLGCRKEISSAEKELMCCLQTLNFLPNDKILDWSKLKAFADNKINDLTLSQTSPGFYMSAAQDYTMYRHLQHYCSHPLI